MDLREPDETTHPQRNGPDERGLMRSLRIVRIDELGAEHGGPTCGNLPPHNKSKLVRFAHNWNNGILESWNDGFKENRIQSAYYCIDFLVLMEEIIGQKSKT